MKVVQVLKIMLLFAVLGVLMLQVTAQEGTEEPVEIIATENPVIVVDPPADVDNPVVVDVPAGDPSELSMDLVDVIIGLLTAFAAGGIVGIAGLAVFVDRIRNDSATVTALEKLAESYPPGTRELLLGVSSVTASIGKLGQEVFDDVPMVDKPILDPSDA